MSLTFPSDESALLQLAQVIEEIVFIRQIRQNIFAYWSPKYQQMTGCKVQEFYDASSSWITAVHPQDREKIDLAWQKHLAGENFDQEYRILTNTHQYTKDQAPYIWLHSRFVYLDVQSELF